MMQTRSLCTHVLAGLFRECKLNMCKTEHNGQMAEHTYECLPKHVLEGGFAVDTCRIGVAAVGGFPGRIHCNHAIFEVLSLWKCTSMMDL